MQVRRKGVTKVIEPRVFIEARLACSSLGLRLRLLADGGLKAEIVFHHLSVDALLHRILLSGCVKEVAQLCALPDEVVSKLAQGRRPS